jgi:hypothetical protein
MHKVKVFFIGLASGIATLAAILAAVLFRTDAAARMAADTRDGTDRTGIDINRAADRTRQATDELRQAESITVDIKTSVDTISDGTSRGQAILERIRNRAENP